MNLAVSIFIGALVAAVTLLAGLLVQARREARAYKEDADAWAEVTPRVLAAWVRKHHGESAERIWLRFSSAAPPAVVRLALPTPEKTFR